MQSIVDANNMLRKQLEDGLPVTNLMETWDYLQNQCAMFINSDLPGVRRDPNDTNIVFRWGEMHGPARAHCLCTQG